LEIESELTTYEEKLGKEDEEKNKNELVQALIEQI
jgi:hypothetical protein